MAIDAGDNWTADAYALTLTSDGSGSQGDLVKYDGSGQVTPTTANGDPVAGVLAEDSPGSAGDEVVVWVHGPVMLNADGSVSEGDVLQPSGTTNGHAVAADTNEGLATAVDEGGTDTYDIYSKYVMSFEGSVADGDVFRAFLG